MNVISSSLTVNETLLLAGVGLVPLGQVLGVSVFQTGNQYTTGGWRNSERKAAAAEGISFEVSTLTDSFYLARHLALERLQAQARDLGAHMVAGVRAEKVNWSNADGPNIFEFKASGTAMLGHGPKPFQPVLSSLSGSELRVLLEAGYEPTALVAGNCYWRHMANRASSNLLSIGNWSRQGLRNAELEDVTQAVYEARERAISRMQVEARQSGAQGVVSVKVAQDFTEGMASPANSQVPFNSYAMVCHFFALGTAVIEKSRKHAHSVGQLNPASIALGLG